MVEVFSVRKQGYSKLITMPRDAEGLYQRIVNQDGSVLFVPVVLPVEIKAPEGGEDGRA